MTDALVPRYTPSTTFETFPFPAGLTPNVPASSYAADPLAIAIAEAVQRLVELRDRWLNPPEWVEWVDEPVPGYAARQLKLGRYRVFQHGSQRHARIHAHRYPRSTWQSAR